MKLRAETVASQRKTWRQEFEQAERTLNAAWAIATDTTVHHPDGNAWAGRIMLGLYAKVLNNLASIIIQTERGLPTASIMREMTEALITLSYIATDPRVLAEQYVDGIILRDLANLNRRLRSADPEIRARVREDDVLATKERVADIESRRDSKVVGQMRRHWSGITIEQMAQKAGLPPILYEGLYAVDSGPTHAMDAADYLQFDVAGSVTLMLASGRTLNHLVPAIVVALKAMDVVNRTFQLGGEKTVAGLEHQIRELNATRAAARSHETLPNNRS